MIIVIAWKTTELVPDGKPHARDLGHLPTMREQQSASACVWIANGSEEDEQKARDHLSDNGLDGRVYCFADNEPQPLDRAKAELLGEGKQPQIIDLAAALGAK